MGRKTIIGSKIKELGIPSDIISNMFKDNSFGVIIENFFRYTTKILKRVHVKTQQGLLVARNEELCILGTAITQHHIKTI